MKDQKQVQEDISRMSSKAISRVQDDIKNLKQLLSVSASGLQRQGLAIDKLKLETAQVKTLLLMITCNRMLQIHHRRCLVARFCHNQHVWAALHKYIDILTGKVCVLVILFTLRN